MSTTTKTQTSANPINDLVESTSVTKSHKIRVLVGKGFTKSQVAQMLGIRYQHVRNVLLQAPKKAS
jgi:hypothetical protein